MQFAMAPRFARAAPYTCVLIVAVALYHVATQFEYQPRPGTLGPDVWPKAILLLTIAVCVWEIAASLLLRRGAREVEGVLGDIAADAAGAQKDHGASVAAESYPLRLVLGMAATIIYVAVVTPAGFFLSTCAYLAAFLVLGRYSRWGVIAALSVLGSLALMFIFMKLVYVSLPIGEGVFAPVMLFLMGVMGIR